MTLLKPIFTGLAVIMLANSASAQVFVIGTGHGGECFENTQRPMPTYNSAERPCTKALRDEALTYDNRAATFVNRGIIKMRFAKYDEAIEDYQSALKLRPALGEAYLNEGAALIYKQLYQSAIPKLDKAIELNSSDLHAAYYNRAIARENTGDVAGAYYDFLKALELKPDWDRVEAQLSRFRVEETPS